eukprot:600036-Ditylum_brightwellii.AAC.1
MNKETIKYCRGKENSQWRDSLIDYFIKSGQEDKICIYGGKVCEHQGATEHSGQCKLLSFFGINSLHFGTEGTSSYMAQWSSLINN